MTTSRRSVLLGGGVAAVAATAARSASAQTSTHEAGTDAGRRYRWLPGDHHVHSLYSNDAMLPVATQAQRARDHGLAWVVMTDHGNAPFLARGVDERAVDLERVRADHGDEVLVFGGLEWNIPGGEHTTLVLAPGSGETDLLRDFVRLHDARVNGTRDGTPANEAAAVEALRWLDDAVRRGRVPDAVVLPNHPCRLGINSPSETRAWRDAAPDRVVGMEGAPGHQAAGTPPPGMARARGLYDSSPGRFSFPGFPAEAYRTWGGFDWMTATVGGVWDSMLAEGRRWTITATSDCHQAVGDWVKNPVDRLDQRGYDTIPFDASGASFQTEGRFPPPVLAGRAITEYSSLPPGAYSKTWVGARRRDHASVMEGLRAGRVWVAFGDLVAGLELEVRARGRRPVAGMGEEMLVRRGEEVDVVVRVHLQEEANHAGVVPVLANVDLVLGEVTGPVADRDTQRAPGTRVVRSWAVEQRSGVLELVHRHVADGPFYVRVRGSDGRRTAPGFHGADVDPAGPAMDVMGESDPWADLWFYSNAAFVRTRR